MSVQQSILAFEMQHRDDAELSLDNIAEYRRLLQQFNWHHVNQEIHHLYDIEKHRVLTKLELRKLFLLTQIRNQRTYRADPKLDAALKPGLCLML